MAGHSKWANIQHRKGAQDKKRAALFSRLSKELTIASKRRGPDADANPRLRAAVAREHARTRRKNSGSGAEFRNTVSVGETHFGDGFQSQGGGAWLCRR